MAGNDDIGGWFDSVRQDMIQSEVTYLHELSAVMAEATPVKTGKAKGGYHVDSGNKTLTNDVEYIMYLNDGTDDTVGKHFVEQAINTVPFKLNKGD